jgi:hypothetical protein
MRSTWRCDDAGQSLDCFVFSYAAKMTDERSGSAVSDAA